jgi:hypothetical protein
MRNTGLGLQAAVMAEETNSTPSQGRPDGAGRGSRSGGGNRDIGGFRIRLSDNEMQAARALQEAFGLRSTVAVLGFALRTLAQQLEEGQLEELVARIRAQGGGRPPGPRRERDGERPERGERRERGERGERRAAAERSPRVDPFARPARPAPAASAAELGDGAEEPAADSPTATPADGEIDAVIDAETAAVAGPAEEASGAAPLSGAAGAEAVEAPAP